MTHVMGVSNRRLLVVLGCLLALVGCNTPDAVSKFCASAQSSLASGNAIFDDMKQSCLREVNSRSDFGTFKAFDQSDSACASIGNQADGLKAATQVVSDYFLAINGIASFGIAKLGDDVNGLVTKASIGVPASQQAALGSVGKFLTTLIASGYQQKKLATDIPAVSKDVEVVVGNLAGVVQSKYIDDLLNDEEKKLAVRYGEFLKTHPGSAEVILSLNDRWQSDEAGIAAKRSSAMSYISAMKALAKGDADLAAHANHITAKELPALLSPYSAQLQALIPAIQKAF